MASAPASEPIRAGASVGSEAIAVTALTAGYARKPVIRDVNFVGQDGEISALIGANGAGKSTFLKAIFGLAQIISGRVRLNGSDATYRSPRGRVLAGIVLVPQGGPSFAALSVQENLLLASFAAHKPLTQEALDGVYDIFPVLRDRGSQPAGRLSGGERGMLALARALVAQPKILLLDEPSIGLSPSMVNTIASAVRRINRERAVTVLLVEQHLATVRSIADRISIMKKGAIVSRDLRPADLTGEVARQAYLA